MSFWGDNNSVLNLKKLTDKLEKCSWDVKSEQSYTFILLNLSHLLITFRITFLYIDIWFFKNIFYKENLKYLTDFVLNFFKVIGLSYSSKQHCNVFSNLGVCVSVIVTGYYSKL